MEVDRASFLGVDCEQKGGPQRLKVCCHQLEINIFIFELKFCKRSLRGQWSTPRSRGDRLKTQLLAVHLHRASNDALLAHNASRPRVQESSARLRPLQGQWVISMTQ